MSIKAMNWVWENSEQKGSALLLLLAIADYAHDDGSHAFPSIATLAQKTRMSRRNVQLLIQRLQAEGDLTVDRCAGPNGVHMYSVVMGGGEKIAPVKSFHSETDCTGGVKSIAPDPSINHHSFSGSSSKGNPPKIAEPSREYDDSDPEFGLVCKAYQTEIDFHVNEHIAIQLSNLMEDFGFRQVLDAIHIANEQGKRNLAYVKGILNRRREGNGQQENGNGRRETRARDTGRGYGAVKQEARGVQPATGTNYDVLLNWPGS